MGIRITEKLRVDVDQECHENPVYVRWIGSRGGWNFWLFTTNQLLSVIVGDVTTYTPRIQDLATAQTMEDRIGSRNVPTITVGANFVPRDKLWGDGRYRRGLSSILTSPRVQVWIPERSNWLTVQVKTGSFRIVETRESGSSIELELSLPDVVTQTQA